MNHILTHASGTPPTRVLTVNNPQLAASNMAMQNASVKELQRDTIQNQLKQYGKMNKRSLNQNLVKQLIEEKGKYRKFNYNFTCSKIYALISGLNVLEHVVQLPTFQLDLEENASPSFLPTEHV